MIYAVSDLHGCYEKYYKMLDKIEFTDNDTLYILGDIVDRGNGGIKILQDIFNRKNVIAINGNHDYTARIMLKYYGLTNDNFEDNRLFPLYLSWLYDGGTPTFEAFIELDDPEKKKILAFMNTFLIYEDIEVNGRKFFLSHTVPEKSRMLDFDHLDCREFIVGEPDYDKKYYDDKFIVTGHTPTGLIDENSTGKIYKNNNHIAIDCGAVFDNPLGCICLDTLEEFYID